MEPGFDARKLLEHGIHTRNSHGQSGRLKLYHAPAPPSSPGNPPGRSSVYESTDYPGGGASCAASSSPCSLRLRSFRLSPRRLRPTPTGSSSPNLPSAISAPALPLPSPPFPPTTTGGGGPSKTRGASPLSTRSSA